ncbi:hypothetical protein FCM35_KLT08734 [Carex littledalei]|uniref:Uncharacterized protein n=1 Tax=Carex littledalei TaxID=544730 RepID=A0A833QUV4_9POAL|nr:hypothetical protein FCM35_KLT08734 [Carex littledalei]
MDNSISSYNSKESSSWALYMDSFMLLSEGKAISPSNPDCKPNYNIGDASYLLKDLGFKKRRGRDQIPTWQHLPSFSKKRRGRELDDSLEDTASSPVDLSKMKTNVMIQDSRKHVMDEANEMSNADEIKYGCNALRKRGLCLVPLSMLIDYLG